MNITITILLNNDSGNDKIFDLFKEFLKLGIKEIDPREIHFSVVKMYNGIEPILSDYDYLNNIFPVTIDDWEDRYTFSMNKHLFIWEKLNQTFSDLKGKIISVKKGNFIKFVFFVSHWQSLLSNKK